MPTPAKLELTFKITQLPQDARPGKNEWTEFTLEADGLTFSCTVRPKIWNKLAQAQAEWPLWVAAITGSLGAKTSTGYILNEPAIQVFERKAKAPPASGEPLASGEAVPA